MNFYGSILDRKRTSLFRITEKGLIFLSDVPGAGDTAYAGFVIRGDDIYFTCYTSDIRYDWPWIMGMVSASPIMMAKLSLPSLEALAVIKTR